MENKYNLSDAALEARRAYLRQWRKKNPEKRRAAVARYWERKAEQAVQEQETAAAGGDQ